MHTRAAAAAPNPSHHRGWQDDELHASKKRKVVAAPPPNVYAGFSSTDVTGSHQYKVPKASSTSSVKYGSTTYQKGQTYQSSYPKSTSTWGQGSSRVRKVYRFDSEGGRDGVTGDIITPSSWRTGKELAEKILREQQQRRDEEQRGGYKPSSEHHSPSSSSQLSSYRDSLDADSLSSHSVLSPRSYDSLSGATSPGGGEATTRPPMGLSPPRNRDTGLAGMDSGSDSFHSSGQPLAPQLSSDMKHLLQELESPSHEHDVTGGGAGERPLGGKAWGRGHAAEPASKKTKYSYGKCFES